MIDGAVLDVPEDEIVRARRLPEGVALVPRNELEQALVLVAIEIEVVRAVVAGEAVLFREEALDREMPDELRQVEEFGDRLTPRRVARLVDRPDQPLDVLRAAYRFLSSLV